MGRLIRRRTVNDLYALSASRRRSDLRAPHIGSDLYAMYLRSARYTPPFCIRIRCRPYAFPLSARAACPLPLYPLCIMCDDAFRCTYARAHCRFPLYLALPCKHTATTHLLSHSARTSASHVAYKRLERTRLSTCTYRLGYWINQLLPNSSGLLLSLITAVYPTDFDDPRAIPRLTEMTTSQNI